jgi:cytochrome P450
VKHLFSCPFRSQFGGELMLNNVTANITRLALRAFTLSNGTYIPAGTKISAAADPQHFDPEIFGENATEFDGFRFIKLQNVGSVSQRLATSTSDYIAFGYGRHIW